jgi:hypothetical protein
MSVNILGKKYNIQTTVMIDISVKDLTECPAEIVHLINLEILYIYFNELTSFPAIIGKLTTLKELYLCNNNLLSLSPEIGNLINLEILYLDNNKLTSLPPEIGNLTRLKKLSLHYNSLTSLPAEMGNLINLEEVTLRRNSLTCLPKEILKIKNKLKIHGTSYQIDNLDPEAEIIIFSSLDTEVPFPPYKFTEVTNLPFNLKEIWLKEDIDLSLIKVPFGCEIKYFL